MSVYPIRFFHSRAKVHNLPFLYSVFTYITKFNFSKKKSTNLFGLRNQVYTYVYSVIKATLEVLQFVHELFMESHFDSLTNKRIHTPNFLKYFY